MTCKPLFFVVALLCLTACETELEDWMEEDEWMLLEDDFREMRPVEEGEVPDLSEEDECEDGIQQVGCASSSSPPYNPIPLCQECRDGEWVGKRFQC